MGRFLKKVAGAPRRLRRRILGGDGKVIDAYLRRHDTRKLHLGCGKSVLGGWLNADLDPGAKGLVHVDGGASFPFDDETFDYVFSEHMIEHIPYGQGQGMLRECHRVLKHGGRIRLSTPDLAFLLDLYGSEVSELQKRYIGWATDRYVKGAPHADATFVINNFVRAWGHQFIYDERTLRDSMERAGFVAITRCELNESGEAALRDLENEQRLPSGFLRLETLTLEGAK